MALSLSPSFKKLFLFGGSVLIIGLIVYFSRNYVMSAFKKKYSVLSGKPSLDFSYSPHSCGSSDQEDGIKWRGNDLFVTKKISLSGACSFAVEGDYEINGSELKLIYTSKTQGDCWCINEPALIWKIFHLPHNNYKISFEAR